MRKEVSAQTCAIQTQTEMQTLNAPQQRLLTEECHRASREHDRPSAILVALQKLLFESPILRQPDMLQDGSTHLLADYVVDLGQDALERQLHVGALEGTGLDEAEALLLAELLRVLRRDAPQMPAGGAGGP